MKRHYGIGTALMCLAVLLTSLACAGAAGIPSMLGLPPTPGTSDLPTGSSLLSGDWNAKPAFGSFAFTVDPDGKQVTTAVVHVLHYTCGGTTLTTGTHELVPWPITDDEFAGRVNLGDTKEILDVTFEGKYDSATKTFSGTWDYDAHTYHCRGDWQSAPHK